MAENGNGVKTFVTVSATFVSVLFVVLLFMIGSVNSKLDTIIKEQSSLGQRVSVCETQIKTNCIRLDRIETKQ